MQIFKYKNLNYSCDKKNIYVFINRQLFFKQFFFTYNVYYFLSKKQYTFLYVSKILSNFGLLPPIKKYI